VQTSLTNVTEEHFFFVKGALTYLALGTELIRGHDSEMMVASLPVRRIEALRLDWPQSIRKG